MGCASEKSPALPCGEVDEPAKAGGTAITNRASGFLVAEACTPRGFATHLGKHWLNEPSTITNNAGTQTLKGSYRFQGRGSSGEDAIQQAFQLAGAFGQLAVAGPRAVAAAEELVGDVERRQHREPQ